MQTEARVGVVVDGGQRGISSGHGSLVAVNDAARKCSQRRQQGQQEQQQSHIGTVSQLLAGGIAGAFSKTCTAPLARLTILFQVQGMHSDVASLRKPSICSSTAIFFCELLLMNNVYEIPGVESYRGNATADSAYISLEAVWRELLLQLLHIRWIWSGHVSAQTNIVYYRGIWHAFQTITREEGLLGLYKGLGATLLGVGPSIAISFSVYEMLRSFWQSQRPDDSTVAVSLACGSLSGIASSTATFPLDLVRRRKQLEGAGGRARIYQTGIIGTLKHIVRSEGFRGLYRVAILELG
ncbi:hypothetical protein MLD38_008719 [Melastoma candidum]|uniref:Uncharacterized protein n=1 Tax=Melastoma candidum TaxID=119954 RepID=A0ACB9RVT1_9MYRT|nr:hypothetical protein MLD38_008719 [Melastoma candidum]